MVKESESKKEGEQEETSEQPEIENEEEGESAVPENTTAGEESPGTSNAYKQHKEMAAKQDFKKLEELNLLSVQGETDRTIH